MDELFEKEETAEILSELDMLKERATQMGIQFHPNIGIDKLRTKVNAVLNNEPEEESKSIEEVKAAPTVRKISKSELVRNYHIRLRKEANKLVRVRITCMNPNKKNYPGEIISISNDIIGTIKKFVPFHIEDPYHIPAALLKVVKDREYQHFVKVKLPNGRTKIQSKMLKEFAIEELPSLTKQELKDLAQRQAMNRSID